MTEEIPDVDQWDTTSEQVDGLAVSEAMRGDGRRHVLAAGQGHRPDVSGKDMCDTGAGELAPSAVHEERKIKHTVFAHPSPLLEEGFHDGGGLGRDGNNSCLSALPA